MLGATHDHLRAARDGDDAAREALLERLRPRLVLWAATRLSAELRSKVEPEDVAQEILLALHKGLDGFSGDDERAFRAWVFIVAENRIRDLAAHAGALKRRTPEPLQMSQTSPSGAAMRIEAAGQVRAALARLPEDMQRVILLRRFEELDTAEVAQRMDRSAAAVRTLYFRAIQALKKEMS